jgi:2'-5' RNA ligase
MLIVIRRAPVEITLDGLLTFGGDKPRILAARVQPTTALSELQADLELLLRGFILYSSRDSVGGGPYIVEANYSLE